MLQIRAFSIGNSLNSDRVLRIHRLKIPNAYIWHVKDSRIRIFPCKSKSQEESTILAGGLFSIFRRFHEIDTRERKRLGIFSWCSVAPTDILRRTRPYTGHLRAGERILRGVSRTHSLHNVTLSPFGIEEQPWSVFNAKPSGVHVLFCRE